MLKTMRNSFHKLKWTLFAVIGVFVLGFVFWSGSGTDQDPAGQVVASIGNERITAVEFDRQYRAQLERYRQMYQGNFSPELERALDLPRNVLDSMIERKLRLEAARRLDLSVADDELADKIVTLPFFQENGQFVGREAYERALRSNGLNAETFEEEMRQEMLLQKYGELVKASVVVPEADILREYAEKNDRASIEYVLVPASRIESSAQPSDADLQGWLDKNKDRYRTPVQRRLKYLLVDKAKVRSKVKPADAEIAAEYEKRKDEMTVPEQVNAAHILVSVKPAGDPNADALAKAKAENLAARAQIAGADFAKLANENTDDPSGKTTGGQLPPFSRGQMVPEFEAQAFAMEPGEIRGPIKTQFGYHIIKFNSKVPGRTRSLAEARPALAAELSEKQASAEVERLARELAQKLKGMSSASDEDLRKLQSDVVNLNTTEWAAKGDPIQGIGANANFSEEAWKLSLGKVSSTPITLARGAAFVKASEERPEGVPPFAELKAKLEQDWKAERRDQGRDGAARARLEGARRRRHARFPRAALRDRGQDHDRVRTGRTRSRDRSRPASSSPPPSRRRRGRPARPFRFPTGFVLFRVLTRTEGSREALATQKEELRDTIRSREAERLTRAYLQQMRTEQKVEVNEALLSSFMRDTGARS